MLADQGNKRGGKKKLTIGIVSWCKGFTCAKGTLEESKNYYKKLPDEWSVIIEGIGMDANGKDKDGKTIAAEDIKQNTLPDYWDDNLWEAINLGSQCEKRGLPFALGWAEHPAFIMDILEVYDSAIAKWRANKAGA